MRIRPRERSLIRRIEAEMSHNCHFRFLYKVPRDWVYYVGECDPM